MTVIGLLPAADSGGLFLQLAAAGSGAAAEL